MHTTAQKRMTLHDWKKQESGKNSACRLISSLGLHFRKDRSGGALGLLHEGIAVSRCHRLWLPRFDWNLTHFHELRSTPACEAGALLRSRLMTRVLGGQTAQRHPAQS